MSAGCMPLKEDRIQAFQAAKAHVKAAWDILRKIEDPDEDPREWEKASGHLLDAQGEYCDKSVAPGFDDLLEHYFS